jgi:hypothetical protein
MYLRATIHPTTPPPLLAATAPTAEIQLPQEEGSTASTINQAIHLLLLCCNAGEAVKAGGGEVGTAGAGATGCGSGGWMFRWLAPGGECSIGWRQVPSSCAGCELQQQGLFITAVPRASPGCCAHVCSAATRLTGGLNL